MSHSKKNQDKRLLLDDYPKGARKLILTAERLFGQYGIDNVSLRKIVTDSGQANNYAVQHHFGSKEGLIEAIFNLRIAEIDVIRAQGLDALKQEPAITPEKIIDAIFLPLHNIFNERVLQLYASFIYQLFHRNKLKPGSDINADVPTYSWAAPAATELNELLRKAFSDLPDGIFMVRYRLAADLYLNSINEYKRLLITGEKVYPNEQQFWNEIKQIVLSIFSAPYPPKIFQQ